MAAPKDRKSAAAAGKAGGEATEDGDFVALRERRKNRELEQPDIFTTLPEIQEQPSDVANHRAVSAGRRRGRPATAGNDVWERLTEAAGQSPMVLKEALNKVTSSLKLNDAKCRSPRNNQNIFNYVLETGAAELINMVVEMVDESDICHQYDFSVKKIQGKKHALHQAVERNDLDLTKRLLAKIPKQETRRTVLLQETPVDITGQRPRTFSCLHLSAFHGFTDLAVYLIEQQGLNVNQLNAKRDTSLLWAARFGHMETVSALLRKGAKPGVENDKGSTALYWAVRYGHTQTVELLAREGKADVNQTRKLGLVAPIVLASALGMEDIVNILLEFGADVNMVIRGGERPLHHAAREGYSSVIQVLLSKGATVDAADERGDTALLLAAMHGRAKALQILLDQGANVSHKNLLGQDVWTFAVENDNDLILKLLVLHQRKHDLDDEEDSVTTAPSGVNSLLYRAASAGTCDRIDLLLKMKIDPGITDDEGNTFLHYAAKANQAEVIRRFHKHSTLDAPNKFGNTALHEACDKGNHEAILELISIKAMANIRNDKGETALHVSAYCKNIQPTTVARLMEYLIKTHPWESLNIKDNEGNNPLHLAAKHARPDVLWEFRFVRFKDPDVDGNIALHESVRPGEPDCLETMLDIYDAMKRDCDINYQNKALETPLYLAAKHGFLEGMKRLMLFGADISLANENDDTVLHLLTSLTVSDPAHCRRYLELIAAILEKAPLWYASKMGYKVSESDKDLQLFVKRRAILRLVSDTHNKEDLSVLGLACKLGANHVVRMLYSLEDVLCFTSLRTVRYDVTNITPKTNGTLGSVLKFNSVTPRPSYLEWLLSTGVDYPQNAAKVLDSQPFRDIEGSYGYAAAWTYAIIMLFHIVYMSLHSWSGVYLLEKSRTRPGVREADSATLVLYIVSPMEPIIIFLYHLYLALKTICMGDISRRTRLSGSWTTMMYSTLTVCVSLLHCVFVILWIVCYAQDFYFKDYILAVSLCIGWLYTIAFTRGFKIINYFWRLIQIMIVKDMVKFAVVYLFVLMAFSFAFHALFQVSQSAADTYPTPFYTLFLMFNMMIGMEYVFEDGTLEGNLKAEGRSALTLKIFYIIYMLLATIVLLNLLIAMMNDSYQAILQRSQMAWRIESVKLGVDLEKSIPFTFQAFSKVRLFNGFICKSDSTHNVRRWYMEVPTLHATHHLQGDDDTDKGMFTELRSKVDNIEVRMSEQMQQLRTSVEEVHSALRAVERALDGKPRAQAATEVGKEQKT